MVTPSQLQSERVSVADSPEAIFRLYYARNWSDGLPIIPPTPEAVAQMLQFCDREPDEVLGPIPPKYGVATVEKLAINAVMAGCLPQYFPVVLTAIEALLEKRFNLYGIQATTHPCGALVIVNGPIAQELEINSGYNVFGQGWRANATIGRAVRLVLMNVGGGLPGRLDRATMGQPGKFTSCIAENEEASPWEPLHVERGYPREVSTVTVHAGEAPHNINDHESISAEGILLTAADTMAITGNNHYPLGGEALLILGPEHADTVARDGYTKKSIKEFLYQHARRPLKAFSREKQARLLRDRYAGREAFGPEELLPMLESPERFLVMVAGGSGKHSMCVLTFGSTLSVTKPIARRDGTPVGSVEELRRE